LLVRPDTPQAVELSQYLDKPLSREQFAAELLRRPELGYAELVAVEGIGPGVTDSVVAMQVEIRAKYAGYLLRQTEEIERQRRHGEQTLPLNFDYNAVHGLSNEVCERLREVRPLTLSQAARIPGVTPAAVSLLLVHIKKHQLARKSA
jgi:tRNA uridine 5-carboxymethylaminomethyl modification enzyme